MKWIKNLLKYLNNYKDGLIYLQYKIINIFYIYNNKTKQILHSYKKILLICQLPLLCYGIVKFIRRD